MVKRDRTSAHYGLSSWLAQRISAIVMLIYTVLLSVFVIRASQGSYTNWQALFDITWVKVVTSISVVALIIHGWVGMRNIWMDYIHLVSLRLLMYAFTIVWLLGSLIYSFSIVWKI